MLHGLLAQTLHQYLNFLPRIIRRRHFSTVYAPSAGRRLAVANHPHELEPTLRAGALDAGGRGAHLGCGPSVGVRGQGHVAERPSPALLAGRFDLRKADPEQALAAAMEHEIPGLPGLAGERLLLGEGRARELTHARVGAATLISGYWPKARNPCRGDPEPATGSFFPSLLRALTQ